MYRIVFAKGAVEDLRRLPVYYQRQVIEGLLGHQPTTVTRNRKQLVDLRPPWEAVPPIWELRVGEYRVFYDVDEREKTVSVRAVRRKPAGARTEEIL